MQVKGGVTHRKPSVYRLPETKVNGEPSFLAFVRIRERIYKKEHTFISFTKKNTYIIYKRYNYYIKGVHRFK